MTAVARTITSDELTPQQRHYQLFDAVLVCRYSSLTLFEPGAASSLRSWAQARGLLLEERSYGYGIRHLVATTTGVEIAVQLTHTTEGR